MANFARRAMITAASVVIFLGLNTISSGDTVEELHLEVPIYNEIKTHIHRPAGLKPGEKLPALLLLNADRGFEQARNLSASLRIICVPFNPNENLPAEHRGWAKAFGHAGQDSICLLLKHLLQLTEVDRENVGIATFSFAVVGATGALARHPELSIKFLIDWEGPSGPQNMKWIPPDSGIDRTTDPEFWDQRTASDFVKRIRCRYLRIQAKKDHVQTLGANQHAIEMLNNATRSMCPWTRCNDNPPNILYDERQPQNENGKWLPGSTSLIEAEKQIAKYVQEMIQMPPLATKNVER